MKKLLLVLVLGGALLFPIVGWADTEDEASATLTLTAVINVNVEGDLSASIDQPGLHNLATYTGTDILWLDFTGLITVKVVALTDFLVHMSYDYSFTTGSGSLGDVDAVLQLMDGTNVVGYIPWALVGGGIPATTLCLDAFFLGENNTPGETAEFGLKVNLDELGDRHAGDVILFTITVWIEDPTI